MAAPGQSLKASRPPPPSSLPKPFDRDMLCWLNRRPVHAPNEVSPQHRSCTRALVDWTLEGRAGTVAD